MKPVLAFLVAALVPTCLMTLWYLYGQFTTFSPGDPHIWISTQKFFIFCWLISLGSVVLLGVPAYLFLRWRNLVRWWSSIAGGFVMAALTVAIGTWPLRYSEFRTSSSFKGVWNLIDGVPTAAGWLRYAEGVCFFGILGAVSGLSFWLVLRALGSCHSARTTPLRNSA